MLHKLLNKACYKDRRNTMPMVGKKKYPYTKKGKAAAKKAAKKMGKKVKMRKY